MTTTTARTTHDRQHDRLVEWKAAVDRDKAIVDDPASDYIARGAAQASLNIYVGPRYHNALEDHIRGTHGAEPDDPWPLDSELEAQHARLHAEEVHDAY